MRGEPDPRPKFLALAAEVRTAVYLAEVPDALDGLREEVKSYLESEGLRVLPEVEYCRNEAAVNASLNEAVLFVQLLNDAPGKRLLNSPWSCVGLQNACPARTRSPSSSGGIARLTPPPSSTSSTANYWRTRRSSSRTCSTSSATSSGAVREILLPPPPRRSPGVEQVVFIDVKGTEPDLELSQQVSDILFSEGLGSISSLAGADSALADQFLEAALAGCAGLLLIHGTDLLWLAKELLKVRKLHARYARLNLGLCDGPPTDKPRCNVRIGQHAIDCRAGVRGHGFATFIAACKGGSPP